MTVNLDPIPEPEARTSFTVSHMRDGPIKRPLMTAKHVNYADLDDSALSTYAPESIIKQKSIIEILRNPTRIIP